MKPAIATLAHGLIFGLAVSLTGATAQAGLYEHIDDHSHDIEREAERAEAIVKYNFRHAPPAIVQYLQEGLCGVAKSAHELHELTRCSGNVLAIDAMTSQLEAQFFEVKEGVLVLNEWASGSNCSVRRFSNCFASCKPRSVDRANLASLDRRIRDIDEELCEMKRDLQKVLVTFHHSRHSSRGHVSSHISSHIRVEPVRPIIPLGTYTRPGHDFSRSPVSSRSFGSPVGRSGFDGWNSRSSSHSHNGVRPGSRDLGHSRTSDSSYIHTRIGGFGLSFRLK
ncbi:MAG: hypothetical protein O2983_10765 [Planctomycetota bacterium]|nr:hypothetical protein [Planctomycetota bacterium]MDA0920296.1 hypothetical protein [Planctomycetota bacterium]MDA1160082.1 hypothetical protein [Planctomycetota bacterium]